MKYGERLRIAREHKGLSQDELVKISGVKQGTISKIERGDQNSSGFDAELSHALGIEAMWLKKGLKEFAPDWLAPGEQKNNNLNPIEVGNVREVKEYPGRVPLISRVQAGAWCEAIDNFMPGDADVWFICPVPHGKRTYALVVEGDSMTSPFPGMRSYNEGVIIFVDPDVEPTSGKRVIAKLPNANEATFKEYRIEDGKHYLKPLNPSYKMMEIDENVHICGVVIGQYTPE
jgi:SOS-response transcriptional repressor LexA